MDDKKTTSKLIKSFLDEYLQDLEGQIESTIRKIIQKEFSNQVKMISTIAKPGAPGREGRIGKDGRDGYDGLPGKDGKDGKDGKNGLPGAPGARGTAGKDGSPDKGEEIVNKINALPTDDDSKKIDVKHIKGLKKDGKMGGIIRGGMEQIRQEDLSSQCDGSNQTFTLTQNAVAVVALLGSQAPLVYQPTTHFTFTAPNTITLLTAGPDSGQVLVAILQTQ